MLPLTTPIRESVASMRIIIPLEFSGDKCTELDRFNQGDVVTVSFVLQWAFLDESRRRIQTYGIHSDAIK